MLRAALLCFLIPASLLAQAPDDRQIHWQRSLDDALALARATHRPLLIAVNMDGESASDRIVRENYRDPHFVAATRGCVCVVGSLFRHNPRDHDDQGRRIPCPRLGELTCGEHIALEPQLFESFLADGPRVAPRHALVGADGAKLWDLSLSFDLRDIDAALVASLRTFVQPPATTWEHPAWPARAARRDQVGRLALEDALARTLDGDSLEAGLAAIAAHGDRGARDALRILAARWPSLTPGLRTGLVDAGRALNLEQDLAAAFRDGLRALGGMPAATTPGGLRAHLHGLAAVDGSSAATRSLLLACRALAGYAPDHRHALAAAFDDSATRAIEEAVRARGGELELATLLRAGTAVLGGGRFAPLPKTIDPPLPNAAELIDQLTGIDERMKAAADDPALQAEYAIASLRLARRQIELGGSDVPILLEDAELHFARALELDAAQPIWWIERARTAYFLQRFDRQVEFGRRALALATAAPLGLLPEEHLVAELADETAIEALRWISDGHARLLAARSGQDPAVEILGMIEGLRAIGLVATSAAGDAKDWLSFASFFGAIGLWREELAVTVAGAMRFPAAADLRQALNAALWNGGRIELAPGLADRIADAGPPSADAEWFAGYARILAAEDGRRREDLETALQLYAEAAARFEAARTLQPGYAATCEHWIAMTWLGRGMAEVRAQRREEAAACLAAAAASSAWPREVRDGLGYEVLDLIDKILEWRRSGPSPVRPLALLDRLDAVAAADPFWAIAVADAALREALRADGRNPERAMRETVDAEGAPITMMLGLPNEAGDALLRASIDAALRAVDRAPDDQFARRTLAQSATIWAERMFERGRNDEVRPMLELAARQLDREVPGADATESSWRALARSLREDLGEARPRWREGR
jgi:hypothetical protein